MRVRCVSTTPTDAQAHRLGIGVYYRPGKQAFDVTPGQEMWVYIDTRLDELVASYPVLYPLLLFEILDGTVPAIWHVMVTGDGGFAVVPPPFADRYFVDDVIEGHGDAPRTYFELKAYFRTPPPLME